MRADDRAELYGDFGRRVRFCRKRIDMTQEALGELVDLSRTSITNIERGAQQVLFHQLFAFAYALEVDARELLPTKQSDLEDKIVEEVGEGDQVTITWVKGLVSQY